MSRDSADGATRTDMRYPNYVLFVLVLVYVFNFIDRQILSILAQDIKADLGLSDASLGFLYGTAFAVFYAIFGIPLGRLADIWTRKNLISIGLSFWSLMTALSGTAKSFASLATYRIGVGVGESSASPAAFSMLGDYFPPRLRATAVAIYSSGVYIGSGIGMAIGGQVVDRWNRAYMAGDAPFGLAGWQVAFFVVGIPGILMALWVWTLKEPVRGMSEGLTAPPPHPSPFKEFGKELMAVLPPFTLFSLLAAGAGGAGLVLNLGIAAACALGAWGLTAALGGAVQWFALAVGLYSFFSWVQGLALRDRPTFKMIYTSRTMVFGMVGFSWLAFVGYIGALWVPPFFLRVHEVSAAEAGTVLGISAAVGGWIGVSGGGYLSDLLKHRNGKARLWMGAICALLSTPIGFLLLTSADKTTAYVFNFVFQIFSSCWIGSAVALANELVMPRMRATASAFYILAVTFIGLALGPYTVGQLSDRLAAGGADPSEALRSALLYALVGYGIGLVFLWVSSRTVEQDEGLRLDRAREAGEPV